MWPNDRDVVQGGSRHFQLLNCFVNINGLQASIPSKIMKYKIQIPLSFPSEFDILGTTPLTFSSLKGINVNFWGGGEMNCTWITNSTSVLFCCCFLFCLKRIMFSVHSLFLLLMKVRIFRSPRCYSLPPWSPPLYWLKRAIRISVQRSSWRWRSFISLQMFTAESDPVLSICLLLPCHDQNAT